MIWHSIPERYAQPCCADSLERFFASLPHAEWKFMTFKSACRAPQSPKIKVWTPCAMIESPDFSLNLPMSLLALQPARCNLRLPNNFRSPHRNKLNARIDFGSHHFQIPFVEFYEPSAVVQIETNSVRWLHLSSETQVCTRLFIFQKPQSPDPNVVSGPFDANQLCAGRQCRGTKTIKSIARLSSVPNQSGSSRKWVMCLTATLCRRLNLYFRLSKINFRYLTHTKSSVYRLHGGLLIHAQIWGQIRFALPETGSQTLGYAE